MKGEIKGDTRSLDNGSYQILRCRICRELDWGWCLTICDMFVPNNKLDVG